MAADPVPARLLDITRLMRRAGRVQTGIDRVELAYLHAVANATCPGFGLVRTPLGFLLLDADGLRRFADRIERREAWGAPGRLSRVFGKLSEMQQRAMSDLRRLAVARCSRQRLARMLGQWLPPGFAYLNVGHSNLNETVVAAVRHGAKGRFVAMVHDTIPLDFPQFQTDEAVARFRRILRLIRAQADLVIYNSQATRDDAQRHMSPLGAIPPGCVAHLGVPRIDPDPEAAAGELRPGRPYFITVGTIEPRKNHILLLDIWERMAGEVPAGNLPALVICGSRGWKTQDFVDRLETTPLRPAHVIEHAALGDAAIAALVESACGALYPSLAEGFGLPVVEAAARGVPVICADLPVYREVLGDIPVYASPNDSYLWQRKIMALASGSETGKDGRRRTVTFDPPNWSEHFNKVFSLT